MPTTTTRPEHLTPDDDLFVRMEHALGLPVVNQAVWRLPHRLAPAHFATIGAAMSAGRMSRLVVRTSFPLRDRWSHTPEAGTYEFSDQAIDAAAAPEWALAQVGATVDSVTGPAWRMTAVTTTDTDETFVSWVSSHVIGDGGALITAISEALDGVAFRTDDPVPGVGDMVREGARTVATSASALYRLLRDRRQPVTRPPSASGPAPLAPTAWTGMNPTVVVDVAADAFDAAAAEAGGTANTLFTAITIGVLHATGRVRDGDEIPVGLPVSTRVPGDRRANATTGVTARITVTPELYTDLRELRAASKAAFAAAGGEPGALALMGRIVQPLGDGIVARLTADSRAPLCLASNLGALDTRFASLGTGAAGSVAMRSVTVGASLERMQHMAGGVSGWSSRSAGTVTLCLTALDPDRVPDSAALSALVAAELERRGLSGSFWARR